MNYTNDEKYMLRCLQLAAKGIGTTRPNPSVGAVVVLDGCIIGEGFTSPYGGPHAEVNAINAVLDKNQLTEASLYVTLEPCSHHGKTPPCADLIIAHQIKNIYIGCLDTHSLVSGKGIERLQNAGCKVHLGILEAACRDHHKRFFTVQEKKRPFVLLKWAETKDGFIAPKTNLKPVLPTNSAIQDQKPVWISNAYSQQLVHKWRAEEQAILVGANTVLVDNPSLTVRHWKGVNPIRIVLDKHIQLPIEANVFDGDVPTILVHQLDVSIENSLIFKTQKNRKYPIEFSAIDFFKPIAKQLCDLLQGQEIQSVMIEGGAQTLQAFIDEGLWDETRVFAGDLNFGSGVKAPRFKALNKSVQKVKSDLLSTYEND